MDLGPDDEVYVALSLFDVKIGPRLVIRIPPEKSSDICTLEEIKSQRKCTERLFIAEFFDFHRAGDFFTHIFNDQLSFNKLFDVVDYNNRGKVRSFMLTALVSLNLMRKIGMLQYYDSIKNLFDNWADIMKDTPELVTHIVHGVREDDYRKLGPIYSKMQDFHKEIIYLISVMPEVVSISRSTIEERLLEGRNRAGCQTESDKKV